MNKTTTALSYEYILRNDCAEPSCSNDSRESRMCTIDWIDSADEYAEPGYTKDGEASILFGNWNKFSRRACDLLERAGYTLEWLDEWTTCEGCGNAFRTEGDSCHWRMYGMIDSDGCYCGDCIKSDPTAYLEKLEDDATRAITIAGINPADHGYTKHDAEYQNGWYPGQNDSPASILGDLHDAGHTGIVFEVTGVGQFDVHFTAWIRY